MTTQISERLRSAPHRYEDFGLPCYLCEAAEEIDRLTSRLAAAQRLLLHADIRTDDGTVRVLDGTEKEEFSE